MSRSPPDVCRHAGRHRNIAARQEQVAVTASDCRFPACRGLLIRVPTITLPSRRRTPAAAALSGGLSVSPEPASISSMFAIVPRSPLLQESTSAVAEIHDARRGLCSRC